MAVKPVIGCDMWPVGPGRVTVRVINQPPARGEPGHLYTWLHPNGAVTRQVWRGNTWHTTYVGSEHT